MPRPRDIQRDPTSMDSDPDAWRDSFHAERFPDRSADEVTVDTLARSLPQASLEGDTDADEEMAEPSRRPGYLGESARIGRYAVLRTLGEGGMGVVYSAYDEELDRRVALKLLRPGRDNSPHNQARMQREARAMARLSHPNVVQVYEVGRWEQQVYVAMEFVQGWTLGAWLRAASHTWQQILDVLIQAGRGLQAAHQANVVHGDFKPDNILIDADDRPRVVDFGLSRTEPRESPAVLPKSADPGATSPAEPVAADAAASADSGAPEAGRSQGGRVAGTPAFMAAEQHAGRHADARTDQFAFAITLYTALYGQHPFAGGSLLELVINVTDGKIRPIPADTPVPPGVHAAIVRALSKEPEQRFASVGEFLDELERGSGRARDPEFDLSVARRQRVVLATVIAASIVAISIVIIVGSPEGGLMPTPASNAIAGGVINAVLLSLIFAFRRSFFKNTINRRVMGWLVVSSLTMLVHRTAAVILATPVETAMVNDLLLLGAVASMAAIAIDAWIGYAAAIMLFGALLCIALPALSALILVSALVGVFVLAFRYWSR